MARAEDVNRVRRNVDEPDDSNGYSDEDIGDLIDKAGIDGASALVWREKAAKFASLVDVTEAGATHRFSALSGNALKMAQQYDDMAAEPDKVPAVGPVIRTIERD
jgi:hypothetical protein